MRHALIDLGMLDRSPIREHQSLPPFGERRQAHEDEQRRISGAHNLWSEGVPVAGTLAERYLRARAISADPPPTLRFHPGAWHASGHRFPALLAAVIREGELRPVGLHRTYLSDAGCKADIEPNKAMLGACAGGAARLACGSGPLVVAEGVETALSLLDALAGLDPNVWAGLSAAGLAGLRLPAPPGELHVAPDGDAAGLAAAKKLASRAQAMGWTVFFISPTGPDTDWNDLAMKGNHK